jgi:uncharacterized protein (DUF362 family)
MNHLTRRQLLRLVSVGVGALSIEQLLAACGETATPTSLPQPLASTPTQLSATGTLPANTDNTPIEAPTPTEAMKALMTPTASSKNTLASPAGKSGAKYMVVARGGEPEAMARQAFAALGGMEAFVKKGADVIIKPNICTAYHTYEYATTTNPWLVAALVKMALEAGARRVRVMDSPFGGEPKEAYAISGIADLVAKAGGTMEVMSNLKFKKTDIPKGKAMTSWAIYEDILKADVLINVPIAKVHSLAGLTLGMKNLMGVILYREDIHMNLGQRLADLASRINPTVTVVDAVRILVDHGPTGGSLNDVKKLDTLIVSKDIVAADTYAASLFGKKPDDLDTITAAAAMGLGSSDLSSLNIEEINVGA